MHALENKNSTMKLGRVFKYNKYSILHLIALCMLFLQYHWKFYLCMCSILCSMFQNIMNKKKYNIIQDLRPRMFYSFLKKVNTALFFSQKYFRVKVTAVVYFPFGRQTIL